MVDEQGEQNAFTGVLGLKNKQQLPRLLDGDVARGCFADSKARSGWLDARGIAGIA